MKKNEKKHHRGRRGKKTSRGIVTTIVLILTLIVFCVSGYQLFKILKGYADGRSEYEKVRELAITQEDTGDTDDFSVDFDALLGINPDTIGWIRFSPEPAEISYPIVQCEDNDRYLTQTFSSNENTLGAIFLNAWNHADFNDRNSIIYGHRMKDGSMFRHLQDYDSQEFWESNPYFYIYTPDGRKITYHIFSAGQVEDVSEIYLTEFATDDDFLKYLNLTKQISYYDTGIEVNTGDCIVTLSTCTSAGDNYRFVVLGVKESEEVIGE